MLISPLLFEKANKIVLVNKELYYYNVHDNNTSFVFANSCISSFEREEEFSKRYIKYKNIYPRTKNNTLRKAACFYIGAYILLKKSNVNERKQIVSFFKQNINEILKNKQLDILRKVYAIFIIIKK